VAQAESELEVEAGEEEVVGGRMKKNKKCTEMIVQTEKAEEMNIHIEMITRTDVEKIVVSLPDVNTMRKEETDIRVEMYIANEMKIIEITASHLHLQVLLHKTTLLFEECSEIASQTAEILTEELELHGFQEKSMIVGYGMIIVFGATEKGIIIANLCSVLVHPA